MNSKLKFGSLFAGIGGFDLGFERAGMACKWQVEIDDYATKILEKHWPKVHRERDIRQCGKHNLKPVDVICGGFPCQDISYAGLGAGLDGERSGLFFEAIRLVRELRPRAIVLENVAALLTRGLDRVLGTLAEIGYDAEWHCIPAAYIGAPHIRDRVFVLAYAESPGNRKREESPSGAGEAWKSGAEWVDIDGSVSGVSEVADTNSARLEERQRQDSSRAGQIVWPEFERSDWWAVEPAVGRVAHGIPMRVDRLRGLGNAVVPQVAELVGRLVVEMLNKAP